jgi:hypothetical protein
MDPMSRVRDFLRDNVGHMTYPGMASFPKKLSAGSCRSSVGRIVALSW